MTLNFADIYSNSWNIFKKNWWEFIVVSIIMFVLVLVPLGLGGIFQFFVTLLIINAILKSVKDEKISFSTFFKVQELLTPKIITIVVAIGLYTLIVQNITNVVIVSFLTLLGFVLTIIFFPLMCVMVDKNFDVKETILYSAKLTKGVRFEIVLLMIINFIIGILGIALFFIGILVATPIITIAAVFVYLALDTKLTDAAKTNVIADAQITDVKTEN